jgi:hypothetical protein
MHPNLIKVAEINPGTEEVPAREVVTTTIGAAKNVTRMVVSPMKRAGGTSHFLAGATIIGDMKTAMNGAALPTRITGVVPVKPIMRTRTVLQAVLEIRARIMDMI